MKNNILYFLQVITELGLVIYSALDFGLKENEERTLTPGLENLLDFMTSLGEFLRNSLPNENRTWLGFPMCTFSAKKSITEFFFFK